MREIKFRYVFKNKHFGDLSFYYLSLKEIEKGALTKILQSGMVENEYEIIARNLYIGLKDKDNKEIYEGDIVRWGQGELFIQATIKWFFAGWCPFTGLSQIQMPQPIDCEIIGNIYENPKLLKGDK